MICRHYRVEGRVQGVGFRYFTTRTARRLALSGWVRNCSDGSVEARACGEPEDLKTFEETIRKGPSFSRVSKLSIQDIPDSREQGEFQIVY